MNEYKSFFNWRALNLNVSGFSDQSLYTTWGWPCNTHEHSIEGVEF